MAFNDLTGKLLDKTYQGVMASVSGINASDVYVPNDPATMQTALQDMITNVFDKNSGTADSKRLKTPEELSAEEEGMPSDSPKANIINIAKKAKSGADLAGNDIFLLHALLAANGHAQDKGFKFDDELTQAERDAAGKLAERYEAGNSTLQNQGLAADDLAAAAEKEARLAAAENAAAQGKLSEEFGFKALGFDGTRAENIEAFAVRYQEGLQRESAAFNGKQINIHGIMAKMEADPSYSAQVISHVVSNGDYREQVVAAFESGDVDAIMRAETILGSKNIDGKISAEEIDLAKQYASAAKGLGTMNFRFTNNDAEGALLEKEISTSVIRASIENGSIPLDAAALPQYTSMINDPNMPIEQKATLIASHLSNERNFIAYDNALKARGIDADLIARLDRVQTTNDALLDAGINTEENVVAHQELAAEVYPEAKELKTAQAAVEEKLELQVDAYYAVLDGIPANFTANENTPPEALKFSELKGQIDVAESELTSYRLSPVTLNENNPYGIKVMGMTGVPYGPLQTALENNVMAATNAHKEYFEALPTERKQAVLKHIDDPAAPLAKPEIAPEENTPKGIKPDNDNLVSQFKGAHDHAIDYSIEPTTKIASATNNFPVRTAAGPPIN